MISGLPISQELLEKLKEKLNVGNLRSIQLNCIPGKSASRLDLTDIDTIEESLSKKFLEGLFNHTNQFSQSISFGNLNLNFGADEANREKKLGVLSKRLNTLTNYNKEDNQEYGYESFGFGFPIVVIRPQSAPQKVIKAPLFIWHLSIEKDLSKTNTWKISRTRDHEIEFNNLFRSYLGQLNSTNIEGFSDEDLEDGVLDLSELIENTTKFVNRFTNDGNELTDKLIEGFENGPVKIPSRDKCEELSSSIPRIIWGGVFGRFHMRNEAIRQELNDEMEELIENEDDEYLTATDALLHSETSTKTDPSQLGILNYLIENKHLIIQGPPGTGKSESITGIIINALEHGKKCLVVCEKKTAMEVLRANIREIDPKIGELVAVVEDVSRDRKEIVESVRDRYDQYGNAEINFPPSNDISYTLELIEQQIRDITERKRYFYKKEFIPNEQPKGWTAAVGKKLQARLKNNDRNLVEDLVKKVKYSNTCDFVSDVNFLKSFEIKTSNLNGFNLLNFIPKEKIESLRFHDLKKELSEVVIKDVDSFQKLANQFVEEAANKEKLVDEKVETILTDIDTEMDDLMDKVNELLQVKAFDKDGLWLKSLRLFSGLNRKLKHKIELFDETYSEAQHLAELLGQLSQDPPLIKSKSITSLDQFYSDAITEFENLKKNKGELKSNKFEQLLRKSFLDISFDETLINEYKNHQKSIEIFLDTYSSNRFSNADNENLAVSPTLKKIDWVLQCSNNYLKAENESFISHYEWQKEYSNLPSHLQMIVRLLKRDDVQNWSIYYIEWYLHHLLSNQIDITLAGGFDEQLRVLKNEKKKLEEAIRKRIPLFWRAKQSKLSGINIPQLYNKRGSRGKRRNSLRKIASRSFESLTSYFPVMMVSPNVCASMFELEPELFDYVIFDEASQLKIEESLSVLIRGERKIISGDSNQMPPSYWFTATSDNNDTVDEESYDPFESWEQELQTSEGARDLADSESLLEFAELCRFESFKLDFHYRSHHPLLIEFSNAAFYKSRLHPLPERITHSPIQYIRVDGTNENQVNRDEAHVAVEILKNIKPDNEGSLPSVGVATFNQKQKHLVLEMIKTEAQLNDNFRKKYLELEENGLFVKNLENIQGDERDIIILCTTFGPDSSGKFIRNYGPITRTGLGRRLLNVIVTRAKKKIFVLTSIPETVIGGYRQELSENGEFERGFLHAYLAYAKAVSDKEKESIDAVLNFLREKRGVQSLNLELTESPFEESVYQSLIKFIDPDRVSLQHKAGGFRIDIAIRSKQTGKEFLAIECDGATYHGSAEDYAWDNYRQSILEEHGFKFHRIWSRDFWENPDREIEKLVQFIKRQDKTDTGATVDDTLPTSDLDLNYLLEGTNVIIDEEDQSDKDDSQVEELDADYEPDTEKEDQIEPDVEKEIEVQVKTGSKVDVGKVVSLKDHDQDKIIKVKIAKGIKNSKESDGIHIVGDKSPIGEVIMGRRTGETVELNNLEKYYTIIEIN